MPTLPRRRPLHVPFLKERILRSFSPFDIRHTMKRILFTSLAVILLCGESVAQSLAEAARREAERRKSLEQRGVEGKVIGEETLRPQPSTNRNVRGVPERARSQEDRGRSTGGRTTARSYRSAISRIENEIQRCEERLAALKRRQEAEKFILPRVGRAAGSRSAANSRERVSGQILDAESKLKRLQQERLEAYEAGKKAGFLPGELDGHGIVP